MMSWKHCQVCYDKNSMQIIPGAYHFSVLYADISAYIIYDDDDDDDDISMKMRLDRRNVSITN